MRIFRAGRADDLPEKAAVIAIPAVGVVAVFHREANDNPSDYEQDQEKCNAEDEEHLLIIA